MKIAIITGITGQDGSYLAELLLEKGYSIYGIIRRSSNINTHRIEHLFHHERLYLKYGDLTDSIYFSNILNEIERKFELLKAYLLYKTVGEDLFKAKLNDIIVNFPNTEESDHAEEALTKLNEINKTTQQN